MAGNRTEIDELVDPIAVTQIVNLKTESKLLREEMVLLLETSIKLNATLGGSTAATFEKNLKASDDATAKLIANNNKLIDVANKKAAAEENALNKYLVLLSKQQAERDKADAKEIANAEKKAAKLQAIQDKANQEAQRKANVQFPTGPTGGNNPITSEPTNPTEPYRPIITGNENMAITANKSAEAIAAENATLLEQKEVLDSLSVSYRANLELLLALQVERSENTAALKALNVEDAISGERAVFLTAEQLRLRSAIQQTNLTLAQQTKQMLAEDTSGAQMQARLDELRVAIGNLSEAELQNAEIGGIWLAEAERLDVAIKALRGSTGDATKNVGAYTKATEIADKVSAQFVRQLVRMAAQFLLITVIFGAAQWLFEWIKNLDMFTGRLDMATQSWKAWTDIMKEANQTAGEGLAKLEVLNKAAQDNNLTEKERIAAAEKMRELWPDKLKNMSDEAIMNGQIKQSVDELTASIEKQALAEAGLKKLTEIASQELDLKTQRDKLNYAKINESKRAVDASNDETEASDRSGGGAMSRKDRLAVIKSRTDQQQADINAQLAVLANTKKVIEDNIGDGDLASAAEGKPKKAPKTPKAKDTANTDLLEYDRIKLAESQKINKAVLDNEENSYDVRKVALDQYLKDSKALIDNSDKIIDADANLRAQQRINMKLELSIKSKDIDTQAVLERQKLDADELAKHKKALADLLTADKENEQENLESLNQGAIVAAQALNDRKDKLINAKTLEYANGKITEKQYSRDILAINDQYNIDRIAQELVTQKTILAIREGTRDSELAAAKVNGATPEELAKITSDSNKGITPVQNKIGDLTNQLGNAVTKQDADNVTGNDNDAKEKAAQKKKEQITVLEDTKNLTDEINKLADAGYEAQIVKLEKIGNLITENAQIEKDAVNRSLDTQANKARSIAVIDAETVSAQKANQAQIAAEKNKQAKADKAAAIAKIILETAVAIVTALATPIIGPFLAVAAGASGAAQLAIAIATPIPQFAKGTGTGAHKGGLAWIGEKGVEAIDEPGKPTYYSPGTATLANLPRGTKVTPNHMLPETPKWAQSRTDNSDVVNGLERVERAVTKQQTQRSPRVSGWLSEQRKADAWSSYSSNHFK